jgi:hypothetical protein
MNYAVSGSDIAKTSEDESLMKKEKTEDTGHVKGLLGYDESHVVFFLGMNVVLWTNLDMKVDVVVLVRPCAIVCCG